jgi:hypothetical protein
MPRKSAAELAVVPRLADHHRRITAPDGMTVEKTELFRKIVEDCDARHFAQSDAPLLRTYCQAILLGELAFASAQASPSALGDWEKCCRTIAMLSVKLSKRSCGRSPVNHCERLALASKAWPRSVMVREVGGSRGKKPFKASQGRAP